MHSIINHCGEEFRAGHPIETGIPLDGFVQGFPVVFKDVLQRHYREHFGYGLWFYAGPYFPAIQCIWPDKKGRFPWSPNYEESSVPTQPIIS